MTLHTYIPLPMPLSSINILHFMVSEIQPEQAFPVAYQTARLPIRMPWVKTILKGCGAKTYN